MRIRQILARQRMFEGWKPEVYQDIIGVWTIGYGATSIFGVQVTEDTPPITSQQANTMIKADMLDAIIGCRAIYGKATWRKLSDVQQEVLVSMCYQLGQTKLSQFKRMKDAVFSGDTDKWVLEMKDSLWWRQTPRPANALADAIEHGDWQGAWNLS